MAIGEKYAPLGNWLKEHGGDFVKLTFDELNQIIPIPTHAYKNRPSWANLSNPASFCSSWISAGYVVDSISLEEQWVVFRKGEVQGHTHHSKPPYRVVDQKKLAEAIQAGYECYDSMKDDPHHRYLSWEYCHEAFRLNRRPQIDATIDYLCLHLAWYLASWGMLRNSFLMQKDYKIHADVVRLIYQPEWDDLLDLSPEKLSQEYYADRIMKLSESITESYVASGAGIPTETLLTKILLGTVGCVPAYDRYFKKALADTGAAPQAFSAKSIRTLGNLYLDHEDEFEKLRKHCGSRIEYPAAKILDMCFFEYGFQRDASSQEDSD